MHITYLSLLSRLTFPAFYIYFFPLCSSLSYSFYFPLVLVVPFLSFSLFIYIILCLAFFLPFLLSFYLSFFFFFFLLVCPLPIFRHVYLGQTKHLGFVQLMGVAVIASPLLIRTQACSESYGEPRLPEMGLQDRKPNHKNSGT